MNEAPDLIGSAEACTILGVDRSTLSRWVAFKKLTPVMRLSPAPNGAMLFNRSDVESIAPQAPVTVPALTQAQVPA